MVNKHKHSSSFQKRCCLLQTAWFNAEGVCWRNWSVSLYSQLGTTALMVASYHGHIDCVRELVLQGADINLQREVGEVLHSDRDWWSDCWFIGNNKCCLLRFANCLFVLCCACTNRVLLGTSRSQMSETCNTKSDARGTFINNSSNISSTQGLVWGAYIWGVTLRLLHLSICHFIYWHGNLQLSGWDKCDVIRRSPLLLTCRIWSLT